MTKAAIIQSNYIPWKGYFDIIASVDHFVLYENVQFTRRSWRNRNKIKSPNGLQWLTVPAAQKGRFSSPINEIEIADARWAQKHWLTVRHAYSRSRHFEDYRLFFEELYLDRAAGLSFLSDINRLFITEICGLLKIGTRLHRSDEMRLVPGRNACLIEICRQLGADVYVSGPAAREYLDVSAFEHAGTKVEFFDYSGYAEYDQLYPPFEHEVSIIDLLFNTGPRARGWMKY